MKTTIVALLAIPALLGGCADLTRSRDLANPAVPARVLAQQVCSNCHGLSGNATSPNFPNLAGQTTAYLEAQLRGFRKRGREDPAGFEYMWGLSRSLTDDQIVGLAAYYSSQRPVRQSAESAAESFPTGKAIFTQGLADQKVPPCASCHGPGGEGNGPFPRIAGQHRDYLVKQLIVFQRTNERPEGGIMKTVAHELTARDIEDVAAFAQRLPE